MTTFKLTYFAPYNFADFTCEAKTLEEAIKKRDAFHEENGFSIMEREKKSETFGGKSVAK